MSIITAGAIAPRLRLVILIIAIALLVCSCAQFGPDAMRASRLSYNEAVQVSDQRELLLNLVRLRYTEAPEFLAISNISTQMSFETVASIGGDFGEVEDASSAFVTPGASVGYSESPTITFVPQRDKEFTRQLVAPIEFDALYLLNSYGWGLDRTLLLIASEINDISNVVSRESVSHTPIEQQTFYEFITALQRLAAEHLIHIDIHHRETVIAEKLPFEAVSLETLLKLAEAEYTLRPNSDNTGYLLTKKSLHYVIRVDELAWGRSEFRAICRLLNIQPDKSFYDIDLQGNGHLRNIILTTRSLLGVMAFLSATVSVPEEHKHLVDPVAATHSVIESYLKIEVAETINKEMYLPVKYRGYWYYISDSDLESKRTLGLLTSLIRLTISAGGAQNVPVLTLPVSQ